MKTKIILLAFAVSAAAAPSVRADLLDRVNVDIRLGVRQPPPPPEVVVVRPEYDRHGPDPWEQRGHGFAHSQAYYYYPGADVYYRQADHMWFYSDRGHWRSARRLPE